MTRISVMIQIELLFPRHAGAPYAPLADGRVDRMQFVYLRLERRRFVRLFLGRFRIW